MNGSILCQSACIVVGGALRRFGELDESSLSDVDAASS